MYKKAHMGNKLNSPSNKMDKNVYVPKDNKKMVDNAPKGVKMADKKKAKMSKYKA